MKSRNSAPLILGLLIIGAGIGYAGNAIGWWQGFTVFFDGWWTMFLIVPSAIGIINGGFSVGKTVFLLLGIIFLVDSRNYFEKAISFAVPAILLLIGVFVILRTSIFRMRKIVRPGEEPFFIPVYTSVFAGRQIKCDVTAPFRGAIISAVFGSICLDLSAASIVSDAVIDVRAICGAVELRLPDGVRVRSTVTPLFGAVKISQRAGDEIATAPAVFVNGVCIIGEIDT